MAPLIHIPAQEYLDQRCCLHLVDSHPFELSSSSSSYFAICYGLAFSSHSIRKVENVMIYIDQAG